MLTTYHRRDDGSTSEVEICSPCCNAELIYGGEYAAPGYGSAYDCKSCGKSFCWLGGLRILEESVPELTEEGVR